MQQLQNIGPVAWPKMGDKKVTVHSGIFNGYEYNTRKEHGFEHGAFKSSPSVYIFSRADGGLYVGHAQNTSIRMSGHRCGLNPVNAFTGAEAGTPYTVTVIEAEEFKSREARETLENRIQQEMEMLGESLLSKPFVREKYYQPAYTKSSGLVCTKNGVEKHLTPQQLHRMKSNLVEALKGKRPAAGVVNRFINLKEDYDNVSEETYLKTIQWEADFDALITQCEEAGLIRCVKWCDADNNRCKKYINVKK